MTGSAGVGTVWVVLVNEHGGQYESIAGVFSSEAAAEDAVAELQRLHPDWSGVWANGYRLDQLEAWAEAQPESVGEP